jgi:hypothetical protein
MASQSGCSILGDGDYEFDNGALARVALNQTVIRMLTGPSVMMGAAALISEAFFLIQSRATATL